jgi:hypothetical protein
MVESLPREVGDDRTGSDAASPAPILFSEALGTRGLSF